MNPEQVPTYTAAQLERLAHELLVERHGRDVPVPVDVELLLESEPGVLLDIVQGLQERFGVLGAVYRRAADRFLVLIDARLADNPNSHRYRFTVAEELAHLRLHRRVLEEVSDLASAFELMQDEAYHEMDRNARRFASAVLMPPGPLNDAADVLYPALVEEHGFDLQALLENMAILGLRFCVSREAMGYRMLNWPCRIVDRVDQAVAARVRALPQART